MIAARQNSSAVAEVERVHADLLRHFPDLVRELGGNAAAMMRRVGMAPRIAAGEPSLSFRAWVNLLELAAAELDVADFGLRLARLQGGGQVFGTVGVVMKNSSTLGEALEYVARYAHAHSPAAGIRLVRNADHSMFVAHEFLLDGLPNKRQAIEQILLLGHLNALEITGGQARVREIHFRHQPLSSRATYRAHFGGTVRFEQPEDGVVFGARDLSCAIVAPDLQLYASATSYIDRQFGRAARPLHVQVRALIVRLLAAADCSIERICADLQIHPRTLHRRLKVEGKSFEGIKDDVRRDFALRYLQETDYPLSFIAEKLGYAEQSVLTRSCVRWFAASPRRVRTQAMH